jgi:hypothetical protein
MQERVRSYYQKMWDTERSLTTDPDSFISEVSKPLGADIKMKLYQNLLVKVTFLQNLNDIVVEELVKSLKTMLYLEGDLVMRKGESGNWMGLINKGQIAVLSPVDGKIIRIMENGDYLGEMALLYRVNRTVDIRALAWVSMLVLSSEDLSRIKEDYPEDIFSLEEELESMMVEKQYKHVDVSDSEDDSGDSGDEEEDVYDEDDEGDDDDDDDDDYDDDDDDDDNDDNDDDDEQNAVRNSLRGRKLSKKSGRKSGRKSSRKGHRQAMAKTMVKGAHSSGKIKPLSSSGSLKNSRRMSRKGSTSSSFMGDEDSEDDSDSNDDDEDLRHSKRRASKRIGRKTHSSNKLETGRKMKNIAKKIMKQRKRSGFGTVVQKKMSKERMPSPATELSHASSVESLLSSSFSGVGLAVIEDESALDDEL